jgi:uncharacterized membrane protein
VDVAEGKGWDRRDGVIAIGVIAGLVFILIELTGADIDKQASQTITTALALVLFTAFGSVGVALAHWQPRYALFGAVTAILSLLAVGATVASIWSSGPSLLGFGFGGTGGTAGGITDILAIACSASCVLLATVRPGENGRNQMVRVVAIGALALFIALAILAIVDRGVDIGARVYAIIATVYVVADVILFILRLLPDGEDSPAPS